MKNKRFTQEQLIAVLKKSEFRAAIREGVRFADRIALMTFVCELYLSLPLSK